MKTGRPVPNSWYRLGMTVRGRPPGIGRMVTELLPGR
jgi:hypothetical protein